MPLRISRFCTKLHSATPMRFASCCTLLIALLPHSAHAQQLTESFPDAPGMAFADGPADRIAPQNSGQSSAPTQPSSQTYTYQQNKRIFYIIPNFRSVSADETLPAQTPKQKFVTASQDSFDYTAFALAILVTTEAFATKATPEFHQGAAGYARYFWHTYTDQTIENFMVEYIVPVATHEDTRYYTLGRGTFLKRAGYSLSRAVITRTDSGNERFNFSEIVGAGAAAGIANLYYPSPERGFSKTAQKWGSNIGIDAAAFFVREFAPDIARKFSKPKVKH